MPSRCLGRRSSSSSSRNSVFVFTSLAMVLTALGKVLPRSSAARSSTMGFLLPLSSPSSSSLVVQRRLRACPAVAAASPSSTSSMSTKAAATTGLADEEVFDIPPFTPTHATAKDLECIEGRQLCHQVTCAGGPRQGCKHGFPQAFVFHPSKTTLNSGMFRLSCPKLVQAVDSYEAQGALREWNDRMQKDSEMQREFRRVNARHSVMRRSLVEPEHLTPYLERMGEEAVEQILASGIAGVSPEKTEDLKCLHAHLADYLCTHDNLIGKQVYETLREVRGVEVDGCDSCWQQCDSSFERTEDSWWYTPVKNKQKLRSRFVRRTKHKQQLRREEENKAARTGEQEGEGGGGGGGGGEGVGSG